MQQNKEILIFFSNFFSEEQTFRNKFSPFIFSENFLLKFISPVIHTFAVEVVVYSIIYVSYC